MTSATSTIDFQSKKEFPEIYRNLSLVPVFESYSEKLEVVLAGVHEAKRASKTSQDLLCVGSQLVIPNSIKNDDSETIS
jgi:hypothetical protein